MKCNCIDQIWEIDVSKEEIRSALALLVCGFPPQVMQCKDGAPSLVGIVPSAKTTGRGQRFGKRVWRRQ